MGNLSSCCFPREPKDESPSEHDRILGDPTEGSGGNLSGTGSGPGLLAREGTNYGTMANGAKEEANAWNRTLHKMANNVIDVSTMDVPSLEQGEWMERTRIYQNRLNQTKTPLVLNRNRQQRGAPQRRADHNDSHKRANSKEPISAPDLALINEFCEKSVNAVKSGFVVNVTEDLVVQFNP